MNSLILDDTEIDDRTIASLQIKELELLYLSRTAVTDSCLPHLAKIKIRHLAVDHTKITASGMLSNGLPNVEQVLLDASQYTREEIIELRKQFSDKIHWSTRVPFLDEDDSPSSPDDRDINQKLEPPNERDDAGR